MQATEQSPNGHVREDDLPLVDVPEDIRKTARQKHLNTLLANYEEAAIAYRLNMLMGQAEQAAASKDAVLKYKLAIDALANGTV